MSIRNNSSVSVSVLIASRGTLTNISVEERGNSGLDRSVTEFWTLKSSAAVEVHTYIMYAYIMLHFAF